MENKRQIQRTTVTSDLLGKIANQLRIESIRATTRAGSGHPTSCCSAADLVATLFFGHMRFDPTDPRSLSNDRFILSKGHAAPLLYAAWAETGHIPVEELEKLRQFGSPLEGHPTPRLDFVDAATGSLGQGLAIGMGMAIHAEMFHYGYRTYVLLGDGELAEGSVWEAASLAGVRKLKNLVALLDINRLGQSGETAFGHDLEIYRRRFESFGWKAVSIDGHDTKAILEALAIVPTLDRPLAIVARTFKGKGIPVAENRPGWHGKALTAEQASEAIASLQPYAASGMKVSIARPDARPEPTTDKAPDQATGHPPFVYRIGERVATRKAFGAALARVGMAVPEIVVLDGDVKDSTFTKKFVDQFPERSIECFIAEQNMVGVAVGLAALRKIPVAATFGAFFSRAMDQVRMAGISGSNIKLAGTHAGISIGEDGPSQMALEDLAAMRAIQGSVVLCPSDAVSTEKLVERMIEIKGPCYLRLSRPDSEVLYPSDEDFEIGGAKILRRPARAQVTIVATGIAVSEAVRAADKLQQAGVPVIVVDAYSIKPLARELILDCAQATGNLVITVEDHYAQGGLGDAVAGELSPEGIRVHKLAVYELPRSGKAEELLRAYRIDAEAIVEKAFKLDRKRANQAA